tara:strand:- start:345 stop:863 length:519 start_codon:yes stop_codon:yes gene_type:complete
MKYTYDYFNEITPEMDTCSNNAVLIKRNGFYSRALELWDNYPKKDHPYQLIGKGKLNILLDDIQTAKDCLFKVLQIYSKNEDIIDSPLDMNCLSAVEHLGYCLRDNVDKTEYLIRISGSTKGVVTQGDRILRSAEKENVDFGESKKRIVIGLEYLKNNNIWCGSFEKVNSLI